MGVFLCNRISINTSYIMIDRVNLTPKLEIPCKWSYPEVNPVMNEELFLANSELLHPVERPSLMRPVRGNQGENAKAKPIPNRHLGVKVSTIRFCNFLLQHHRVPNIPKTLAEFHRAAWLGPWKLAIRARGRKIWRPEIWEFWAPKKPTPVWTTRGAPVLWCLRRDQPYSEVALRWDFASIQNPRIVFFSSSPRRMPKNLS